MPQSSYYASDVDFDKGTFVFHERGGECVTLPFAAGNLFNVFNVTAAAAICRMAGVPLSSIAACVDTFSSTQGRFEEKKAGDLDVVTMLFKNQNPISGSQSLAYLNHIEGPKDVVLIVTDSKDNVHGHEDISWLYDTDFDSLTSPDVHHIIVGGSRCYDVGLRLTLAGVDPSKIITYESYETLKRRIVQDLAGKGTVAIYFELYAMSIANSLKDIITRQPSRQEP